MAGIVSSPVRLLARAGLATAVAVVVIACSDDGGEPVIKIGADGPGTCLDFGSEVGAQVTELPVVPCEEEHSHEIYAVELSSSATYPGFEALEAEAQAKCLGEFEDYVGRSAFDSELFFTWLVPTLTSWDRDDDREIVCLIGLGDGGRLTDSVAGTDR